jgi:hypothetical protein
LYGSAFAVDFAILWSHFWYRQTVPKMDRENAFFFCSFTPQLCMRSQKWDRLAVPFLGLSLGSFFEVFCIRVEEAQCFGFNRNFVAYGDRKGNWRCHRSFGYAHQPSGKVYLRAFGAVYQDASSIMGGTKPQRGGIYISSISMSSVAEDGKKPLRVNLWFENWRGMPPQSSQQV